jgi:hypothetical protein
MNYVRFVAGRLLDGADLITDAFGSIFRVLLRGRFRPDARSYRGPQYCKLSPEQILVQELTLNAADEDQARRAIRIDPDRYLPLSTDIAYFDLIGPISGEKASGPKAEQRYALGLVRKDTLSNIRAQLPKAKASAIEGFAFIASDKANAAFMFRDAPAHASRRLRRAVLILALSVFAFSTQEAVRAWRTSLDEAVQSADAERLAVERRMRLAERRVHALQTSLSALSGSGLPSLAEISAELSLLAFHQNPDSELTTLSLSGNRLSFSGRSYNAALSELEWRRAFENAALTFSADTNQSPASFDAEIGLALRERGP